MMTTLPRDTALSWFTRLQADDVTVAERQDFQRWHDADPAHAAAFQRVSAFWGSAPFEQAAVETATAQAAAQSTPIIPIGRGHPARRHRWSALGAIAATVMLWLGVTATDLPIRLQSDYHAATGTHREAMLSDGSRIALNSGAAVSLNMDGPVRQVRVLTGEVYFDVARDPDRPFVVDGGAIQTRVLGTRFSVRADPGHERVAVRSGLVQVDAATGSSARLEAGQSVTSTATGLSEVEKSGVEDHLAWLDRSLVFHDRPLGDVVRELNRYHPGIILILNKDLAQTRVSGNYRLTNPTAIAQSLAQVMAARTLRITDSILILR